MGRWANPRKLLEVDSDRVALVSPDSVEELLRRAVSCKSTPAPLDAL
jgi:hypothetical protein